MKAVVFVQLALVKRANPIFHYYLKGKKVLDLACGPGILLKKDPVNFKGLELNVEIVEFCKAEGLDVVQGSCTNLSMFSTGCMDVVNCSNIIEHLFPEDAAKMVFEAIRVLKPEGYLLIDTPSPQNVWNTFSHIRPYTPLSLKKLFSRITETYLLSENMRIGDVPKIRRVFYKGPAWGRVFAFLYTFIFSYVICGFKIPPGCSGYTIVVQKT